MDFLTSPAFWVALGQIILIDILLGGDNAVVIALACRKLGLNRERVRLDCDQYHHSLLSPQQSLF